MKALTYCTTTTPTLNDSDRFCIKSMIMPMEIHCMNRRTKRYKNDHFYVTLTYGTIFDRSETQIDKKTSWLHQPRVAWCNHDVFFAGLGLWAA